MMAEAMNNARIVQADDLTFEAVYDDESGSAVSLGHYEDPVKASAALDDERARLSEGPADGA